MDSSTTNFREYRFGDRWSSSFKKLSSEVSSDEARKYHEQGRPYTVVIMCNGKPTHAVMMSGRSHMYLVSFLDDLLRDYLRYDFREIEDEKLFLKELRHRKFRADTLDVASAEFVKFSPDGAIRSEVVDGVTRLSKITEYTGDVSHNWEPTPGFCRFDSLIRKER